MILITSALNCFDHHFCHRLCCFVPLFLLGSDDSQCYHLLPASAPLFILPSRLGMDTICLDCAEPIKNLNLIKCYLCEQAAHMKCLGWARSNLDFVNEQPNLLWFCSHCIERVEHLKGQASPATASDVIASLTDAINGCFNAVKEELGQTNSMIRTISERLLSNQTSAPSSVACSGPRVCQ